MNDPFTLLQFHSVYDLQRHVYQLLGKTENNVVEIQLARRDGKISGMIVDDNGKVRIGEKGDEFIMHKPGLIGNLNTVSFALKSDKNLFLHSTKKDINFKQSDNSKEFRKCKI